MLQAIIPAAISLLDKVIPDQKQKDEAKLKLLELSQQGELKELEGAMQIISDEAKSEHWLVAAWRPITMLTFVAIVANNYLLYPYLSLFWQEAPMLELPPDVWNIINIGLGGYVIGRSAEKIAKEKYK